MAEDFDIEALLEAPFKKSREDSAKPDKNKNSDNERDKGRDKDRKRRERSKERDRKRSRSRDKKRSRSRDRKRSHSREKKSSYKDRKRSHSREKRRSGSRERKTSPPRDDRKKRSRSRDRIRRRSISPNHLAPHLINNEVALRKYSNRRSPPFPRPVVDELTPEERDARTVFCMQLSQRVRGRDLEEFFSSVGKVRDVKLITCNKTRRFKGIAYVEFKEPESVALAMGLTGQKLLGIPIVVQPTQAEKNRQGGSSIPLMMPIDTRGPMRLYIGSLHFNITEDMLRGIFEPFGKIESIQLMTDPETGRSKGYGFITFRNPEDAKKALEQLNGFELAGRPMKVGNVQERIDALPGTSLDTDELDRSGIDLGATGRLQLMYKLAEGTGLEIPAAAASALSMAATALPQAQPTPPIATQCFMLANMFDPATETMPTWDVEIRDDVIEECNKHGGVLHVYVDKAAPTGNVYCKCPTIATAVASVNTLHGRWFAGRVITAAYVPLINYHSLFPDALAAMQLLLPSRRG